MDEFEFTPEQQKDLKRGGLSFAFIMGGILFFFIAGLLDNSWKSFSISVVGALLWGIGVSVFMVGTSIKRNLIVALSALAGLGCIVAWGLYTRGLLF